MITLSQNTQWKAFIITLATTAFISAWLVLGAAPAYAQGPICQVDDDGGAWADYTALQDALTNLSCTEIWVAQGVYYPDEGTGQTNNDRASSFVLTNSVTIYGGFAATETVRSQRNWETGITVLSGDIDGNDTTDANNIVVTYTNIAGQNAYHVVKGGDNAILDGFTITGGNSFGEPAASSFEIGIAATTAEAVLTSGGANSGGGILNFQGGPALSNLVIKGNQALKGGGMYNMVAISIVESENGSVIQPTLNNVTFENNYATSRGGAMANDLYSHPVITNATFLSNSTDGKGGGIYNDWSCSPQLTNCLFAGNSAHRGGALGNDGASSPTIMNCTFTQNYAEDMGAALYQGSYLKTINSPIVTNSILWGNTLAYTGPVEISNWHEDDPQVSYSIVEGGYSGANNLAVDPQFVDAANGDYRLSGSSPAINAGAASGAPGTDLDGNTRDGSPDIGAYEYVSSSVQGVAITQSGGSTNVNEDGTITDTYQVVLNSLPTGTVAITVSSDSQVTPSPGSLTFTTLAWDTPQTVTVTAVDDAIYEGNHTGIITHTAAGADTGYNGISIDGVTVNITDNDAVPNLSITKTVELSGSAPAIPGDPLTYTIVISNSGGGAENVTVTDTLPSGLSGDTLTWSGTLTADTALTFTLNATILNIAANYTATIANTAYLNHSSGNLSATVVFKTISDTTAPGDPTLLTPTNGSLITHTNIISFGWSAVNDDLGGLDFYTLQVDSSEDGLSIQASSDTITTTQTSYTPTTALANGAYTWTVRARDMVGNISTGLTATFTISATSSTGTVYLPIVVKNN